MLESESWLDFLTDTAEAGSLGVETAVADNLGDNALQVSILGFNAAEEDNLGFDTEASSGFDTEELVCLGLDMDDWDGSVGKTSFDGDLVLDARIGWPFFDAVETGSFIFESEIDNEEAGAVIFVDIIVPDFLDADSPEAESFGVKFVESGFDVDIAETSFGVDASKVRGFDVSISDLDLLSWKTGDTIVDVLFFFLPLFFTTSIVWTKGFGVSGTDVALFLGCPVPWTGAFWVSESDSDISLSLGCSISWSRVFGISRSCSGLSLFLDGLISLTGVFDISGTCSWILQNKKIVLWKNCF